MRLRLLACDVLLRELCRAAADSPSVVDVHFLPSSLHDVPDRLRAEVQAAVDACEGQHYDAIVLGYGLCSRGTAGVTARSIPLILPRAHDCITLFLGSMERYDAEFTHNPGTYYFTSGWCERKDGSVDQGIVRDRKADYYDKRFAEYSQKYGEDNARFLIEQETQWLTHYTRATFIDTGAGDSDTYRAFTRQLASQRGWEYSEIAGDGSLLRRMLDGEWREEEVLRIEPGQVVGQSFDERIVCVHEPPQP